MIKNNTSRLVLVISDAVSIFVSIVLAYYLRSALDPWFTSHLSAGLSSYINKLHIYAIILVAFYYEGIYTKRYDFWHESRQVLKALFFSFVVVFGLIALFKASGQYSRMIIIFAFLFMAILIPLTKNILKKRLYKMGLWQRGAKIYGDDPFIEKEIFQNHYLGYVKAGENAQTVFINSQNLGEASLTDTIDSQMQKSQEVVFISLLNEYDMTRSTIYGLSNVRTNLVVITNRLKSKSRRVFRQVFNYLFAILLLPVLLPIIAILAYLIKKEEPNGRVFFKQERMGKDGKTFTCYKFRSMKENSDAMLQKYLQEHPEEIENYKIYHKYENDPRVTNIGVFLRKTSLDELPQIFNILKGEMLFIGPRPYMLSEREKIGSRINMVLSVRPGITGLWQVSGRSDVDFHSRVDLDVYYTRNWSVWLDIVILFKTIKVVLKRDGAY